MTAEHKLKELIEDELERLIKFFPELDVQQANHRQVIAKHLANGLMESRPSYRSGRRISDRLRDTLIDLRKWIKQS